MSRYFWSLEDRDKQLLFDRALHGSGQTSLGKAIYNGRDDSKLIYKHKNGDRDRLSTSFASELLDLSSSNFELCDPEEYVLESQEIGGKTYLILDEEFREYLFHPYKNDEIAQMTGKSSSTCKEYRFETDKSIPKEVYTTLFRNTSEILDSTVELTADLEKPELDQEDATLIQSADSTDIKIFSKIESLKSGSGHFDEFYELIEDATEIMRDDLRGTHIKSRSRIRGRHLSFMDDLGLMRQQGSRTYRIEADSEYLELILEELRS